LQRTWRASFEDDLPRPGQTGFARVPGRQGAPGGPGRFLWRRAADLVYDM